jgi:hypothetical protein
LAHGGYWEMPGVVRGGGGWGDASHRPIPMSPMANTPMAWPRDGWARAMTCIAPTPTTKFWGLAVGVGLMPDIAPSPHDQDTVFS